MLDASEESYEDFLRVDCAAAVNLQRVQAAMAEERVGPHHFAGSTGYGHGDLGRAAFDQVRYRAQPSVPLLFLLLQARQPPFVCTSCKFQSSSSRLQSD